MHQPVTLITAKAKKAESHGVEAVVNAIALTALGHRHRRAGAAAAFFRGDLGAERWGIQRADGALGSVLDHAPQPYEACCNGGLLRGDAVGHRRPVRRWRNEQQRRVARWRCNAFVAILAIESSKQRVFNKAWMLCCARLDGLLDEEGTRMEPRTNLELLQRAERRPASGRSRRVAMDKNRSRCFAALVKSIAHSSCIGMGFATGLLVDA